MSEKRKNEFTKLDRSDRLLEDSKKAKKSRAIHHFKIAEAEQQKIPQAVVKITSYLSGQKSASNHLLYISRNEPYEKDEKPIELEDENGELIVGKEAVKDLINEWRVDFAREPQGNPVESLKVSLRHDGSTTLDAFIEALKDHLKSAYQEYEVRVDRGRYETTKDMFFVSIRQRANAQVMPVIESVQESFQKRFPALEIKVENKKKYQQRDTANVMFSTPKGSKPEAVRLAVRNTAKAYFGENGFRYVFALHTDTEKPHVHVSVKMVNERTGKRLVLNPKDIQHLRNLFVEKAREQGIVMTSSLRYERGLAKQKRELPEIKLQEKMKAMGQGLDKHAKLRADVLAELEEIKTSPLKRAMLDYRQRLKTGEEYQVEIKNLKDRSFTENNTEKKQLYITLYKALEKDMDKRLANPVAQLNERVRREYIEDAVILREVATSTGDTKEKIVLLAMANKLAQYADVMPQPLSEKDRMVAAIQQRAAQKDKDIGGPEL